MAVAKVRKIEDLTKEVFKEILEQSEGFKNVVVLDIGALAKPEGINNYFTSEINRVTVTFSVDEFSDVKEAHFVLKVPGTESFIKAASKVRRGFQHEVRIYAK